MTPKFFGQYLLENGVLQGNQLMEAIKYQKSKTRKFGEIAVTAGFLSEAQAAKINETQKKTDLLFGEIARRDNLLTEKQIEEIVTIQQNSHVYLGEAIVATGLLTRQQVEQALANFKADYGGPEKGIALPEGIASPKFVEAAIDLTAKLMLRMADVLVKCGDAKPAQEIKNRGIISRVDFKSGAKMGYILNLSEEIAHQVTKRAYKKENLAFDREVAADAVGEFVNTVCGNITAALLTVGVKSDITVPLTAAANALPSIKAAAGEKLYEIAIASPMGELSMAVAVD